MHNKLGLPNKIYPGIFSISLPLPGKYPGPVNCYLFAGKNITLIDTGIRRTIPELKNGLAQYDISLSDIDNIILTHGHPDHFGAASFIRSKSGAKVYAHHDDKALIEHGISFPRRKAGELLKLMGVPMYFGVYTSLLYYMYDKLIANCPLDGHLKDGDQIILGDYKGTIITTPGHSMGSICIYLENERLLFSGDHILKHISPNAFAMLESSRLLPVRLSQREFYNSIDKIEKLNPRIIYPGHGEVIENLSAVTKMYRKQFSERQERILKIVESGEFTVYEIARQSFSHLRRFRLLIEIFLTISEVFTHLQVLEEQNLVTSRIYNNNLLYSSGETLSSVTQI